MHAPQIIMIVLLSMSLAIHMEQHGKQKEPKPGNCFPAIASTVVVVALLIWGGFFK